MQFWDEYVIIYCVRHILMDLTIEYMLTSLSTLWHWFRNSFRPQHLLNGNSLSLQPEPPKPPNITCIFDLSSLDKGIGVSATLPPADAQCFTYVLHLQSTSAFLSSQFLYTVIFFC